MHSSYWLDLEKGHDTTYFGCSVCTCCTTHIMGLLLSLPFAGVLGTVASSAIAGVAFCFTSTAGEILDSIHSDP